MKSDDSAYLLDFICLVSRVLMHLNRAGYYYTDFSSQGDYELLLDYARRQGFVLWESAPKRSFVGRASGHASIKSFIEQKGMPAGSVHSYG